jgi:hypothetical protein
MDFGVGIFNEGIRSRDIIIGGVVPDLDQIVGVGVPIVSDLHIGTTR